jgi:hypothetical protein
MRKPRVGSAVPPWVADDVEPLLGGAPREAKRNLHTAICEAAGVALVRELAVSLIHEPGGAQHRRGSPNQVFLHVGCLGERTGQGRPLHLRRQGRLVLHPRAEGHAVFSREHAPVHAALALLACRVDGLAPVAPLARSHFLCQPV